MTVAITGQDSRLQADAAAAGSHRTGFIGREFDVAGTSQTLEEDDREVASMVPRHHNNTLPQQMDDSDGQRRWVDYELAWQNKLRDETKRLEHNFEDLSAEV